MVVPREGLAVQAERVLFENIDFVVEERADRPAIADQKPDALIRVLAAECDFADCSFQSPAGSPELVAAIVWQHASSARLAADALPAGRIRLNNCVFRRVGVGIESHRHGAVGLELVNSLCLGPGPMIRLMHAPAADEPLRIRLCRSRFARPNRCWTAAASSRPCRRARSGSRPPAAFSPLEPRPRSWS